MSCRFIVVAFYGASARSYGLADVCEPAEVTFPVDDGGVKITLSEPVWVGTSLVGFVLPSLPLLPMGESVP